VEPESLLAFEGVEHVVLIYAHPDDADIAAGGTVAKLTRQGKKVTYVTVADGRHGTFDTTIPAWKFVKIRQEEQNKAAEILGVDKVIFLDYEDQTLDSTIELRRKLIDVMRETKPDIVMTHDPWKPYEGNRDHRHTGMMAVEAAGFAHDPFENPEKEVGPHFVQRMCLFRSFAPDTWIDITDTIDLKLKAICQHVSQHGDAIAEIVKEKNALDGNLINRPYAEAFKILKRGFPYVWE
jgi:LmbE family N-acetylglucosaminyl deacetylase